MLYSLCISLLEENNVTCSFCYVLVLEPDWMWLHGLSVAAQTAKALVNRTPLPQEFLSKCDLNTQRKYFISLSIYIIHSLITVFLQTTRCILSQRTTTLINLNFHVF